MYYRVGCNVKPMMRAKISTNKGIIEENFAPFHVNIFATELSDLSERIIMDKVQDLDFVLYTLMHVQLIQILFLNLILIISKTVSTKLGHNLKFYKKPWMGFLYSYMLSEKGRLLNNNNEHKKTQFWYLKEVVSWNIFSRTIAQKMPIWYDMYQKAYLVSMVWT